MAKETKFCLNCGAEIDKNAVLCPKCGVKLGNLQYDPEQGLEAVEVVVLGGSTLICSMCYGVGFLIPIILWLIWRTDKPEKAKHAGYICIGVGSLYLILIISYIFLILFSQGQYYY